ncbi:MAG: hypothetical protein JSW71_07130, partial [Gemmatimonadota bacterium]
MDELIQLLIFGAIILFALLGRKKKPQQTPKPRPRPQQPRPRPQQPRPRPEVPARPEAIQAADRAPPKRRGLAEELFEMLQQQMEAPQRQAP